jgi:hypothetical protein
VEALPSQRSSDLLQLTDDPEPADDEDVS